ncbi:hypothetical protein AJ78_04274 [Emergomyces pasteurianus Ep9510]|uniref:Protein kinase domain-containing protein n=1 Tax=Emergomyces pasteurianus Ep9510 TaxID=1447872 RepID=A0A1J9PHI5_9EURO|nr:hypothetical protein AJ78_04274 [Emergomyces pasteurianus Ep9510]
MTCSRCQDLMHVTLVWFIHPLNLLQFMRKTPTKRLKKTLLKLTLQYLLEALDFLHTEADIVRTDLKSDNIMLSIADEYVLDDFSQAEICDPVPRKIIMKQEQYIHPALFETLLRTTGVLQSCAILERQGLEKHTKSPIPVKRNRISIERRRCLS